MNVLTSRLICWNKPSVTCTKFYSGTGAFINLPTRQRKSNYDVNEYYRARMDSNKNIPGVRKRKVTSTTTNLTTPFLFSRSVMFGSF